MDETKKIMRELEKEASCGRSPLRQVWINILRELQGALCFLELKKPAKARVYLERVLDGGLSQLNAYIMESPAEQKASRKAQRKAHKDLFARCPEAKKAWALAQRKARANNRGLAL